MRVAALVLAAGRGERLHRSLGPASPGPATPKALLPLAGQSLLARSIEAVAAAPEIRWVLPVLPRDWLEGWAEAAGVDSHTPGLLPAVEGGAERQDSVARGLAALPPEATHVAVHDAARPLVPTADVSRVVQEALRSGPALLATPVADTIHRADAEGRLASTPPRAGLWAALTPQVFPVDVLREALEKAAAEGVAGTDDAGLVARLGVVVTLVEGDPQNRKITTAADLAWAEARLQPAAGQEGEAR